MSEQTPLIGLPLILAAQAQKHVTHNEALRVLDEIVHLSVISELPTPPVVADEAARYLVGAGATEAWLGRDGQVAVRVQSNWQFHVPQVGWQIWDQAQQAIRVWNGSAWQVPEVEIDFDNLDQVGVQTTADAVNRLAVASEASLFTHAGQGHQMKLNKAGATDTASLVFQTGWSGRAEFGTIGADDFALKVSADGATFTDAMVFEAGTGIASLPATPAFSSRGWARP